MGAILSPLATRPHAGNGLNEASRRRFGWVVDGHRMGPNPLYDCDLGFAEFAAVCPTLGAIIPEWLLVVPRKVALAVADLDPGERRALLGVARDAASRIERLAGDAMIFEHGAGGAGSPNGCGVDQAHLHTLGLGKSFVTSLLCTDYAWIEVDANDPWQGIPSGRDYFVLHYRGRAWRALTAKPVSQFLRRRVADFVDSPGEWDYRRYPHARNIEITRAIFGRARVV